MTLRSRLKHLERNLGTPSCPECRDRRGLTVLCRLRDGEQGVIEEPAPCPRCDEVPEQIIEIVEVLVTTREEAKRSRDLDGPGDWSAARVVSDGIPQG